MAVKMRLMRMGKTKSPFYRVVVIDGRAPRDGRYIDLIGRYDPRQEPSVIDIDNAKAVDWLQKGAQPTETVSKILQVSGALDQYKVKAGKIHTVGARQTAKVEEETVKAPGAEAESTQAEDSPVTPLEAPTEEVETEASAESKVDEAEAESAVDTATESGGDTAEEE